MQELRAKEEQLRNLSHELAELKVHVCAFLRDVNETLVQTSTRDRISELEHEVREKVNEIAEKDAQAEMVKAKGQQKIHSYAEWAEKVKSSPRNSLLLIPSQELAAIRERKEQEIEQKTKEVKSFFKMHGIDHGVGVMQLNAELSKLRVEAKASQTEAHGWTTEKKKLQASLHQSESQRHNFEKEVNELKHKIKELKTAHQKRMQKEEKQVRHAFIAPHQVHRFMIRLI